MGNEFLKGDCREQLRLLPDCSVDSVVTDPPYELGFMGKSWDASGIAYDLEVWRECLRVLKPGGHLLAFGGSRTYHRLACAVEDAGFEIRDQIMWVYGSGFPKSKNVALAIDKGEGHPNRGRAIPTASSFQACDVEQTNKLTSNRVPEYEPKSEAAGDWAGWGTALKPAHEPIVVARKPLDGTVANNVLKHGVGGLNIDACRVDYASEQDKQNALAGDAFKRKDTSDKGWSRPWMQDAEKIAQINAAAKERAQAGRFPANFIHDGSEEVTELLGEAHRFFYCAKASKAERNAGLDHLPRRQGGGMSGTANKSLKTGSGNERDGWAHNHHPTVKPLALMRYLIRLITPPNGTVLDPFAGSGTTLVAAVQEGVNSIGIELTEDYWPIIEARVEHAVNNFEPTLYG